MILSPFLRDVGEEKQSELTKNVHGPVFYSCIYYLHPIVPGSRCIALSTVWTCCRPADVIFRQAYRRYRTMTCHFKVRQHTNSSIILIFLTSTSKNALPRRHPSRQHAVPASGPAHYRLLRRDERDRSSDCAAVRAARPGADRPARGPQRSVRAGRPGRPEARESERDI